MDDDKSTAPVADAQEAPVTDTSTNDSDTDDVALEDIEISDDEIEETESDDTVESQASDEDESDDESEADEPEQDDDKPEPELDDEAERKRRNDEFAKQRIAEREARQRQKEIQEAQENVRLEQYLKEAQDDDAEFTKRQAEVERLLLSREKVAVNEEKLRIGVDKAIAKIDLFTAGTPEVKEELANAVDDFIAMYVEQDEYGNPVAVHGDITAFLQKKADSIRRIQGVGARQQVKDKEAVKARTVPLPSRTPKEPKADKDLEDFDSAWK